MRRGMLVLLVTLGLAAFMVGGCANKEVVKSEEPVVQSPEAGKATEQARVEPAASSSSKQAGEQNVNVSVAESAFDAVYFDFDKSDLSKDARNILTKNAEIMLKQKPNMKVKIEGNCDERGSAEYNIALGERRAKSAMQYLVTLGVPVDRLSILSYGKEKATSNATDESAWAKDRRDDFTVVK
jgi:peptidoglycan-associated lipoprotein